MPSQVIITYSQDKIIGFLETASLIEISLESSFLEHTTD